MAPNSIVQLPQVSVQSCVKTQKIITSCDDSKDTRTKFMSVRKTKNMMSTCRREEQSVRVEREAMVRQQIAKARGERAGLQILQSKAAEHKEKALELEVLADLLSLRATELLDQCCTSGGDQEVLQQDNLISSITALNHLSNHHKDISQEILLESRERSHKEELRRMEVKKAVQDFNKCAEGITRRTRVSGVNSVYRAALRNRLQINALNQEAWALSQEAKANAQLEQESQRIFNREAYWSELLTNL